MLAEQQGQEWEVLDQKEWDDMENVIAEEPVVVGGKKRAGPVNDTTSILFAVSEGATRGGGSVAEGAGAESEREKVMRRESGRGVNGWMKLKSRSEEGK